MYVYRIREMLEGENRCKSVKRLSLNFFVAFQWYATETPACNLPAESQFGTQIIRKSCFSIRPFNIN